MYGNNHMLKASIHGDLIGSILFVYVSLGILRRCGYEVAAQDVLTYRDPRNPWGFGGGALYLAQP